MTMTSNPRPADHWAQQSPINLSKGTSLFVKFPKSYLRLDYRDAPFEGSFEGEVGHKNFVLSKPHGGKHSPMITLGGVEAELVKIHLHTPSEHDVEGHDLGGEIHLIHEIKDPSGGSELIVIGIFFDLAESLQASKFFGLWAAETEKSARASTRISGPTSIDVRQVLPKTSHWYRYEGSLTSEPYSERVSWLVFAEPLGIDSADLRKLRKQAHQPERRVQPINRRFVLRNFT